MGAPTGSFDVKMLADPRESGAARSLESNPVSVTVAGASDERRLISSQTGAEGVQLRADLLQALASGGGIHTIPTS